MASADVRALEDWLSSQIIGQSHLVQRLIIALLADGHLLVEGAPGLAKTRAIKTLADGVEGSFHRIQFTPDLLPGDVTGTEIYRPQEANFHFQKGPIFHNMVLADEVNRAPAKVQSALLEAMAERQVSVGSQTYQLPELFLVMATQNPIEQEGTYPLPEAQLDRFLMHVNVDYPDATAEMEILRLTRAEASRELRRQAPAPVPGDRLRRPPGGAGDAHVQSGGAVHRATGNRQPQTRRLLPGAGQAGLNTAAARAPPSPWIAAPARTPGCGARTTSAPTMCRPSPPTCSAIACCSALKRRPTA